MNARSFLLAAVVAVAASTAAVAEPAGSSRPESTPSRDRAAPVLMASADVERATGVAADAAPQTGQAPVKRPRTARVTTCRCADTPNP